ncbi:N-acetyltransferase [Bacillus sp. J14TS2]|uniref:GNAT family N-acetyltransferase n=1 Tax=Bacillus sp. J14TS2 TaxID=2807188 RepID=UPI001B2708F9|nr:GNAT family N-acetyltransferase [Bacillus sp. J14TS2]GIN72748.1 N-acetyltransferase [Bacillus sp. J14TS2]
MNLHFKYEKNIQIKQLEALYNDVQWYAYTQDLAVLQQAVSQSLDVLTVWDCDELVGLVRVVGDGLTILYIQDILVLEAYQNQGIATQLMQRILQKYHHVRQKVFVDRRSNGCKAFL